MKKNKQNKSTSKHPRNKDIYIKEYHDCIDQQQREIKAANLASDNKRCWWVYRFLMHNKYRVADNYDSKR